MAVKKTQRAKILEALEGGKELKPSEIAEASGLDKSSVRNVVRNMLYKGELEQEHEGYYRLPHSKNDSQVHPLDTAHDDTHKGIQPQENPSSIIVKNPHSEDNQTLTTLQSSPDVFNIGAALQGAALHLVTFLYPEGEVDAMIKQVGGVLETRLPPVYRNFGDDLKEIEVIIRVKSARGKEEKEIPQKKEEPPVND